MDIHLLKNKQRLGSGEVEHGGGGWGKRGPSNERGVGSEIFDDLLGRGSKLFHQPS